MGQQPNFYPRSPRGERHCRAWSATAGLRFLSTLPARGATWSRRGVSEVNCYFYPRSPRGERLSASTPSCPYRSISIHAPREGSDSKIQQKCGWILRKRSKGGPGGVQNRGAVLCIRYNFSTGGRRSQAFRRCEPCGRGVCAGASHRGACAGRVPGAEALGYTSKTSSWDHCGARPMCSTLVL